MFIDTECIICNDNKAQQFASKYIQINHNNKVLVHCKKAVACYQERTYD